MPVVAAYLRVSSGSQTVRAQRDALRRCARARGDTIEPDRWYSEKASAGRLDRPALAALRAAVRAGEVNRVYCFRIDRLSRGGIRDTFTVVDEFRQAGAELVSVADGFSVNGPAADVVLAVLAWAAEMERAAIGDRIRAARKAIEATGGAWGRPRRMDAATVARARELAKTKTVRQIAVALKIPRSTVADALRVRKTPRKKHA